MARRRARGDGEHQRGRVGRADEVHAHLGRSIHAQRAMLEIVRDPLVDLRFQVEQRGQEVEKALA
ncbi:hypothetical protein D3C83_251970 [compost metagenome]